MTRYLYPAPTASEMRDELAKARYRLDETRRYFVERISAETPPRRAPSEAQDKALRQFEKVRDALLQLANECSTVLRELEALERGPNSYPWESEIAREVSEEVSDAA